MEKEEKNTYSYVAAKLPAMCVGWYVIILKKFLLSSRVMRSWYHKSKLCINENEAVKHALGPEISATCILTIHP